MARPPDAAVHDREPAIAFSTPTSGAQAEGRGYGAGVFAHGSQLEQERLALIEAEQDPYTTARIEALGIQPDWRCLEVGAGQGSIAFWLARQCPRGHVVATDLDVSLLHAGGHANLEILEHDVNTEDFPEGSFDLVHARAVLAHASDPTGTCRRMASWLRPGGWLLVADPASFPVDSSPHALMRKAGAAATATMRELVGTDPNWARTLPAPLVTAGLVDVDAECRLRMMRGGTREAKMFELMLAELAVPMTATGLITADELASLRAALLDPEFLDFPPAVVRAWGRRA